MLSIVVFTGCGPEPEPSDGGVLDASDTEDGGGLRDAGDTAAGGGICCPIEIREWTPCGCWRIGGYAATLDECVVHCDGANYATRTDVYGCTVLDYSGFGSCLPEPDAGPTPLDDAGTPDDAGISEHDASSSE